MAAHRTGAVAASATGARALAGSSGARVSSAPPSSNGGVGVHRATASSAGRAASAGAIPGRPAPHVDKGALVRKPGAGGPTDSKPHPAVGGWGGRGSGAHAPSGGRVPLAFEGFRQAPTMIATRPMSASAVLTGTGAVVVPGRPVMMLVPGSHDPRSGARPGSGGPGGPGGAGGGGALLHGSALTGGGRGGPGAAAGGLTVAQMMRAPPELREAAAAAADRLAGGGRSSLDFVQVRSLGGAGGGVAGTGPARPLSAGPGGRASSSSSSVGGGSGSAAPYGGYVSHYSLSTAEDRRRASADDATSRSGGRGGGASGGPFAHHGLNVTAPSAGESGARQVVTAWGAPGGAAGAAAAGAAAAAAEALRRHSLDSRSLRTAEWAAAVATAGTPSASSAATSQAAAAPHAPAPHAAPTAPAPKYNTGGGLEPSPVAFTARPAGTAATQASASTALQQQQAALQQQLAAAAHAAADKRVAAARAAAAASWAPARALERAAAAFADAAGLQLPSLLEELLAAPMPRGGGSDPHHAHPRTSPAAARRPGAGGANSPPQPPALVLPLQMQRAGA